MKPYKGKIRKAKYMKHIKAYWTLLKNIRRNNFKSRKP